ncbi:MAG TPA: biotin/lipoyl-containing protein [Chloroflexota bacterium]
MNEGKPPLLDIESLQHLLRRLEATDVDELEIVRGSSRLYVLREPGKRSGMQVEVTPRQPAAQEGVPLAAPLTGVFYCRPTPEQDPFVSPGSRVEIGQVVALIETMKLFNEVLADVRGDVVSVVREDGDLVETGQPLMYIHPVEGETS